ncbi:MAG: protein kinase [Planctomycetes bacterium]|nr:protein kinase [Planctomycetota bacterium]
MSQDPGLFERALEECLEAFESGDASALEAVLGRHPAHAAQLRSQVERLHRLGLLGEDENPPAPAPEELAGYRLLRRIGEGGMGLVWEAQDPKLQRRVALKMIRPEQLWFPGARERFRREVDATVRLQHPGIVPVHAVGEEGGVPFYTMELLDGCTLAEVLRALEGRDPAQLTGADLARAIDAAVPPREGQERGRGGAVFEGSWVAACVLIARQVAEALEHAHGRGLVHRDVKPSNIAITRAGRAMLLDFGLARDPQADRMTRTGGQPGSLPYMSPEQAAGERVVDARSDIYSLGLVLQELLTLSPMFEEESQEAMRRRILAGDLASPRARNRGVPRELEIVCRVATAREPGARYATAEDFAIDLGNVLAQRRIEACSPGALLALVRWIERHPRVSAALLTAVPLALASLGALAWTQKRGRDEVLRLADVRRLADLDRDAHQLWPALPARVPDQERWLARAEDLLSRSTEHEAALAALERAPGAQQTAEGAWQFASTEELWRHDTLAELVQGLAGIREPAHGLIADVRARLAFARSIEERSRTGAEARKLWDEAVRSIADRSQCPAYEGLALAPQLGLLPIGRDKDSALWEFAHLASGAPAERDSDGKLVLKPETGFVLVLVPGGRFRMGSPTDPDDPDRDKQASEDESPAHEVELAPYFLSKYVATIAQWERLSGKPQTDSPEISAGPLYPASNISWEEA